MEGERDERAKVVRVVLAICALIIIGVAVYTTMRLFSSYDPDVSFSPPGDAARFTLEGKDYAAWKASFDIEQEYPGGEFGESKTYKDEEVEPYSGEGIYRSPLVVYDFGQIKRQGFLFLLIALEIVVVFWGYLLVDRLFRPAPLAGNENEMIIHHKNN